MEQVRQPAVAGMFYPGEKRELQSTVESLLRDAEAEEAAAGPGGPGGPAPKAIVAPHAGYPFSGPLAARAYARLEGLKGTVERVVLLGPSHRVPFRGLALTGRAAYRTPLGDVPLDTEGMDRLRDLPGVQELDSAHAREHSLEVHVPFLQEVLGDFKLLPVVCGGADAETVAAALDAVWGGPETLIVVSTDLTHFLDYDTARHWDEKTARAVEHYDPEAIGDEQACGRVPLKGLLVAAERRGLSVDRIGLCSSGDTRGPRDQVVGYGAWAFTEREAGHA